MRASTLVLTIAATLLVSAAAHADTRADARRSFTRGMQLIADGRLREGIEALERAYELRPHPNVLFNVGRAQAALGELDGASESFRRYLESDPPDAAEIRATLEDLEARLRLRRTVDEGMKAIREGQHARGVALLESAFAERPHPNLLFNMARALEDAGDADAALAKYRAYRATRPADASEVDARIAALELRASPRRPTEPASLPPSLPPSKPREPARIDDQAKALAAKVLELVDARLAAIAPPRVEPTLIKPTLIKPTTSTVADTVALGPARDEAGYEQVVVTASRRAQSPLEAPNAVTLITDEDIRLSGARSIPDLLRRVPGMDVMQMSASDWNVSVRGFNRRLANKTLVLVDGRTVYQDFLGAMLWSGLSITLSDIDRIEVVRGPGSAIYGAYAYTGIINIITKRPEAIGGTVARVALGNGGALEAEAQHGARIGRVGVRASGGYVRGDKYVLEFDPARVDYTSSVEDPELSVARARLDVSAETTLGERTRIFLGGGLNDGFQELYGVSAIRNQAATGPSMNVRAGFESELFSILAFWDRGRFESTPQFFRTGLPDLGSEVSADLFAVEPVLRPSFELGGHHQLVVGGEYRHKRIDWDYLDGPHDEDFYALFAQDSWSPAESLTVLASGRLDAHPLIGLLGSPRAAVIYELAKGQALRLSIGSAFRQPTQAESYLDLSVSTPIAGVAVTLEGSDALEPERILTAELGYLAQTDVGELEAVVYGNRVGNLITRSPLVRSAPNERFDETPGAFVGARSFYQNDPRVFLAFGAELSATVYPVDGVDVGASYAFQSIHDQDSGDRFSDSPMHKATLWSQLRTRAGIDASLSLHVVSDQAWIEPQFDPDSPSGFTDDPLPLPASLVVIGRVGYRLAGDRVELAISGTNLADFGANRHREHPLGNRLEARVLGTIGARL
ncbi:MAG: TonB-dependent receptor [Deltaproteobacteria bacterium]|nr:TonB-dependent receptor [Deltaproteobacteria bacterium]